MVVLKINSPFKPIYNVSVIPFDITKITESAVLANFPATVASFGPFVPQANITGSTRSSKYFLIFVSVGFLVN